MCTHAVSIMFPIATKSIFQAAPTDETLMLSTIASILSGSVFGDHITPISDTTILSSIASRSAFPSFLFGVDALLLAGQAQPFGVLFAGVCREIANEARS